MRGLSIGNEPPIDGVDGKCGGVANSDVTLAFYGIRDMSALIYPAEARTLVKKLTLDSFTARRWTEVSLSSYRVRMYFFLFRSKTETIPF